MSIKKAIILGAGVGTAVAVLLMSLEYIRPFSPEINALVEKAAFKLCPLYILGFTNIVSTEWALVVLTIIGNALIYGVVFGAIAAIAWVLKRLASIRS